MVLDIRRRHVSTLVSGGSKFYTKQLPTFSELVEQERLHYYSKTMIESL